MEKKNYLQGTLSSKTKSKDIFQMRSKVAEMSNQIKNLRSSLDKEEDATVQVENIALLGAQQLNTQMEVLRNAFNNLADTMVDEMDKMKSQITLDLGDKFDLLLGRIQKIDERMNILETESIKAQRIQAKKVAEIDNKSRQEMNDIYSIIEGNKNDNKHLFDHLKNIILNTNDQIASIEKEQNRVSIEFASFKDNSEKEYENNIKTNQRIINLKKELSLGLKEKSHELFDINNALGQFNSSLELSNIGAMKQSTDISSITHELSVHTKELQSLAVTLQSDLQKNKETLKQDLFDYKRETDNKLMKQLGDHGREIKDVLHQLKLLERRSITIEELMSSQRRELFANISELELNLLKKNDKLATYIRNIDIPLKANPSFYNSPK